MTPHHCRYCKKHLRTWNEREEHLALYEIAPCNVVEFPVPRATGRTRRVSALVQDGWEMKRMKERAARC